MFTDHGDVHLQVFDHGEACVEAWGEVRSPKNFLRAGLDEEAESGTDPHIRIRIYGC